MNAPVRLVLVLSLALVASCVADDKSDNEKESVSAAGGYLPAVLSGQSDAWRVTSYDANGSATGSMDYIRQITGPDQQNGNTYYYQTTGLPGDETRRFMVAKDGIMYRADKSMFDGRVIGTTPTDSFSYDYLFYDFTLSTGVSAKVFECGLETENLYVNVDIDALRRGSETVTTPAGTFTDSPVFQLTFSVKYTPKVTGDTHIYKRVEKQWFGKNAGPVKKIAEYYEDGVRTASQVFEMVEF